MGIQRPVLYIGGQPPATPTVADVPPFQATLPTSAYGQTIPVVWGIMRLPSAYIWCAPILTVTSSHQEFWDTITTTTSLMTARLRFARPLVPNSTWSLRKLYASGKLIFDGTTGYRASGLNFRVYDGRSSQGRDPAMVRAEGEANVSAHRGYIDIVVEDYDVHGFGSPPVFEGEFVQAVGDAASVQSFQGFSSDAVNTVAAADWESSTWYGYSDASGMLRRFSTAFLREIYAVPVNGFGRAYTGLAENFFRYIPEIDRLIAVGVIPGPLGGIYPLLIDPVSGTSVAEADSAGDPGQSVNAACALVIGNTAGIIAMSSFHLGYVSIYRFTATTIAQVSISGTTWDGRGRPECFTPGEIRDGDADIWVCAGNSVWKMVITSTGLTTLLTEFATFADAPLYAVWHDSDLIVWTDNAEAIRIDGTTGAVVWTKAVPYQLDTGSARSLAGPDEHRLDNELFVQEASAYYLTSLDTGLTRSISKATESSDWRYVYDGLSNVAITTDNVVLPQRRRFDAAGNGTLRNLSDLLTDLMVYGGGYDPSEITIEGNIDDQIQGAVFDVTAGVRDIARSICEPYSIAIFER
ncbi:hypothetical protein MesoLj113a_38420 [Mesorhizobium sp. 113-1-2]|uniref:hypothetical protein n=1 Tax=Mesorhizobium sp. 113-1-2 TaxID=2744515 RepID=UPI001926A5E0|nr:hypothetical protein [Mesorhizobium sp. 113-1-2]BCG72684.1 hypothetical protein MesoLj113a_38420 [Mesorhizobium sp. 113-1-2]